MPGLLFVYALDGGMFNAITHYAHKVISPKTYGCNLCAVTNGMLGKKREWAQFLKEINVSTKFLHRDEFKQSYPTAQHTLPAVFRELIDAFSTGKTESTASSAARSVLKAVNGGRKA